MRLGLISDIHGNLTALDVVLAKLDADRVDQIVCLGDLAVLGPQPEEVISRIRERKLSTVCGNTDVWLVPRHPIGASPPDSEVSITLTRWASTRISDSNRAFLRALPLSFRMPLEFGVDVLCCHGSPRSVDDIMPTMSDDGVGEMSAPLLAGGHTHIQEMRRFGDRIYVNPGSVGLPGVGPGGPDLPVNRNASWAEYAVIDRQNGITSVCLRRVPLDVERMRADVRMSAMPYADWWRSRWAD